MGVRVGRDFGGGPVGWLDESANGESEGMIGDGGVKGNKASRRTTSTSLCSCKIQNGSGGVKY